MIRLVEQAVKARRDCRQDLPGKRCTDYPLATTVILLVVRVVHIHAATPKALLAFDSEQPSAIRVPRNRELTAVPVVGSRVYPVRLAAALVLEGWHDEEERAFDDIIHVIKGPDVQCIGDLAIAGIDRFTAKTYVKSTAVNDSADSLGSFMAVSHEPQSLDERQMIEATYINTLAIFKLGEQRSMAF